MIMTLAITYAATLQPPGTEKNSSEDSLWSKGCATQIAGLRQGSPVHSIHWLGWYADSWQHDNSCRGWRRPRCESSVVASTGTMTQRTQVVHTVRIWSEVESPEGTRLHTALQAPVREQNRYQAQPKRVFTVRHLPNDPTCMIVQRAP